MLTKLARGDLTEHNRDDPCDPCPRVLEDSS